MKKLEPSIVTARPYLVWRPYSESVGMVAVISLVGQPVHYFLDPTNLVMLYLLGIVLIARRWGQGPSTLAAFLSVLAFDVFYVPPYLTLAVADAQYLISFLGFLVVGLMISTLTARARSQTQAAEQRTAEVLAAYELSRDLAAVQREEEILLAVIDHISRTLDAEVAAFVPEQDRLVLGSASREYAPEPDEVTIAEQTFAQGQAVHGDRGASTTYWMLLQTARHKLGVLGIKLRQIRALSAEQWRLLEVFAGQTALALERAQLVEQTYQMQLLQSRERLQSALLNSISHDLRTPLASITGVLSTLRENQAALSPEGQVDLLETAWQETQRLNRLVGNLLDMSRLEAGALTIQSEPYDVQDLIGVTLAEMEDRLRDHPLTIEMPADLPMVPMDLVLMVQVMANLLDNAVKYSAPGTPIDLQVELSCSTVKIAVADRGIGIPQSELEHIFEKFYRISRPDNAGGTGLGLSISKGIVDAHYGRIWAEARAEGGTVMTVALPLGQTAHEGGE